MEYTSDDFNNEEYEVSTDDCHALNYEKITLG